jgi:hypothetical protein
MANDDGDSGDVWKMQLIDKPSMVTLAKMAAVKAKAAGGL